ncbi:uncharacterized protein K452DRAFT_312670 [Aplosporella prunicola CBS 121167]|uniref:Uncharacterized protein n=1 Tax=Aplosporella prunicola CBS 121167 TaxID=1176127 RepID=A0A6A6B1L3_9PEZI|nr:uncharacterized protein K452DRAFT_312670 [Aplosporella prunicola CBS 121167]KAF2137114.1 hypothetical protein K452DRAFT_312670 [Aplosporella prunicola CBS 121167]
MRLLTAFGLLTTTLASFTTAAGTCKQGTNFCGYQLFPFVQSSKALYKHHHHNHVFTNVNRPDNNNRSYSGFNRSDYVAALKAANQLTNAINLNKLLFVCGADNKLQYAKTCGITCSAVGMRVVGMLSTTWYGGEEASQAITPTPPPNPLNIGVCRP